MQIIKKKLFESLYYQPHIPSVLGAFVLILLCPPARIGLREVRMDRWGRHYECEELRESE